MRVFNQGIALNYMEVNTEVNGQVPGSIWAKVIYDVRKSKRSLIVCSVNWLQEFLSGSGWKLTKSR